MDTVHPDKSAFPFEKATPPPEPVEATEFPSKVVLVIVAIHYQMRFRKLNYELDTETGTGA